MKLFSLSLICLILPGCWDWGSSIDSSKKSDLNGKMAILAPKRDFDLYLVFRATNGSVQYGVEPRAAYLDVEYELGPARSCESGEVCAPRTKPLLIVDSVTLISQTRTLLGITTSESFIYFVQNGNGDVGVVREGVVNVFEH